MIALLVAEKFKILILDLRVCDVTALTLNDSFFEMMYNRKKWNFSEDFFSIELRLCTVLHSSQSSMICAL